MSKTVLVVDDDPLLLEVLGEMLEDLGCHVIRASDGLEALHCLETGADIEALITDVNMPGIDGYELISRARHIKRDIPAIVISGREPQRDVGIPHLAKPFSQARLKSAVADAIGAC